MAQEANQIMMIMMMIIMMVTLMVDVPGVASSAESGLRPESRMLSNISTKREIRCKMATRILETDMNIEESFAPNTLGDVGMKVPFCRSLMAA